LPLCPNPKPKLIFRFLTISTFFLSLFLLFAINLLLVPFFLWLQCHFLLFIYVEFRKLEFKFSSSSTTLLDFLYSPSSGSASLFYFIFCFVFVASLRF
jgi:hypothetical protein